MEETLDPLIEKREEAIQMAELSRINKHIGPYSGIGNRRKPKDRKAMALAFIAKAAWSFPRR
jgi:hypothetical protein